MQELYVEIGAEGYDQKISIDLNGKANHWWIDVYGFNREVRIDYSVGLGMWCLDYNTDSDEDVYATDRCVDGYDFRSAGPRLQNMIETAFEIVCQDMDEDDTDLLISKWNENHNHKFYNHPWLEGKRCV